MNKIRVINLNENENENELDETNNDNDFDIFNKLDEIKNQPEEKKQTKKRPSRSKKKIENQNEDQNDNEKNNQNEDNQINEETTLKKSNTILDEDKNANKREQLIISINNYLNSRFKGKRLKERGFTSTGLEKKTTQQLESYLRKIKASSHASGSSQAFELGSLYVLSQYEKTLCKMNIDISGTTNELCNNEMFLETLEEVYIEYFSYVNPSPVTKLTMSILGTSVSKFQENRLKRITAVNQTSLNSTPLDNKNVNLDLEKKPPKSEAISEAINIKIDEKEKQQMKTKQNKTVNNINNTPIKLSEEDKIKLALNKLREASE
jgi:hypothetical protein